MKACNDQGIRLITVFEDEWKNNKELCISRITAALGAIRSKVAARKCKIETIEKNTAVEFLNKNHLQGATGSETALGLFYEGSLVSVMTLGKPSRAHVSKRSRVLELKRFASNPGLVVMGGASRLFKEACAYAKKNNYEEIRSYCDMRWGTGNVYKNLGMRLYATTKYTRQYTDLQKRWRNQTFASTAERTEQDLTTEKKLYTIYDCGHQTWIYAINGC
jgi:hypothetical protein